MRTAYCGALINAGKIETGLAQARELLADSIAVYKKDDAHVGSAHALMAGAYTASNRPDMAAPEWKIAHASYLASLGSDSPYTGQAAQGLAENLRWSGRPAEALDILLPAFEIARKTLAADSPDISEDAYDLAMTYISVGNLPAARKMLPLLDRPVLLKDSGNWKAHLDLLDGRMALSDGKIAEARDKLKDADQGFETGGGDDPDATMAKTILATMKSD